MLPVARAALLRQLVELSMQGKDVTAIKGHLQKDGLDAALLLEWLHSVKEAPPKEPPALDPDDVLDQLREPFEAPLEDTLDSATDFDTE